MRDTAARRRDRERAGRWAERAAMLILSLKGYRILARRARTPRGELDLVARKGRILAFIEVKFRRSGRSQAVSDRQKRRIRAAAEAWLAGRPGLEPEGIRFDAFLLTRSGRFHHVRDAWRDL